MRNRITTIIILVSVILLTFATIRGIHIGDFQILSIAEIKQKNEDLNNKINQASTLTSINYPSRIEVLKETYNSYIIQKQKYEELSGFAEEDSEEIYETKQYDIGYLWRVLGKYATSRNLTLGIDVQKRGSNNLYNLNFNLTGTYVNILQFITDIENNSDLYFRIYNFRMSGNGRTISSTFTVRDVNIDPSTITTGQATLDSYN